MWRNSVPQPRPDCALLSTRSWHYDSDSLETQNPYEKSKVRSVKKNANKTRKTSFALDQTCDPGGGKALWYSVGQSSASSGSPHPLHCHQGRHSQAPMSTATDHVARGTHHQISMCFLTNERSESATSVGQVRNPHGQDGRPGPSACSLSCLAGSMVTVGSWQPTCTLCNLTLNNRSEG